MALFQHSEIEILGFEDIPLNQDLILMSEKWMPDVSRALLAGLDGGPWEYPGYVSFAAGRHIHPDHIELSWYPNTYNRFHEIRINLPRTAFATCVNLPGYDGRPKVFVKDNWHDDIYLRTNSAFALVDAIGVKAALARGVITTLQLDALRDQLDAIAANNPTIAFISFADSLLVKANWSVGKFDSTVKYTYEPEKLLLVLPDIAKAFQNALGLSTYAVVTQGRNEFYGDELVHLSAAGHHVSLNSLGAPFAQLMAIESATRHAIKAGVHSASNLYLDAQFFHSLKWKADFDRGAYAKYLYQDAMATKPGQYVCISLDAVLDKLDAKHR